jgi:hypothetical protein
MTAARHTAVLLAALLVPAAAFGQDQKPPEQGYIEFGFRGTTGTVDGRTNPGDVPFTYGFRPDILTSGVNTYRDYRNSLYISQMKVERPLKTNGYFNLQTANNGLAFQGSTVTRDQSVLVTAGRRGVSKFQFRWDEIPHVFSGTTRTLFQQTTPGVWKFIGDRAVLDAARVAGTAAAFSSAIAQQIGNASTDAQRSLRKIGSGSASVDVNPNLNLAFLFSRENQLGTRPLGMCFGNSPSCVWAEIPENIDYFTDTLAAKADYAEKTWEIGLGYQRRTFENNISSELVDNPFSNNVFAGNVTGNGEMGLYPNNQAQNLLLDGAWAKGPVRFSSSVSPGWMTQNDRFVPYTTNTFLLGRSGAAAPIPLPASSLNGERQTLAMNYTFVANPLKRLELTARYRHYDHNNNTEEHTFNPYVGDLEAETQLTTPGGSGQETVEYNGLFKSIDPECRGVCNEPRSFHTRDVDLGGTWFFTKKSSAKVQYLRQWFNRHHRDVNQTIEDTIKGTIDLKPVPALTLRVGAAHQNREPQDAEYEWFLLPGTQRPDEGFRRRNRVDLLAQYDLTETLSVSAFYNSMRDDFNRQSPLTSLTPLGDPSLINTLGPGPTPIYGPYYVYGLLKDVGWTGGGDFDYLIGNNVTLFGEYSRERGTNRMVSRQRSANTASQVGCPSATNPQDCDPINDWMTLIDDLVDSYYLGADVNVRKHVDVSVYYSLARSSGTTWTDGANCQVGNGPNAYCRTNFPNWRLDTAASPVVTFSFPDTASRLHELTAVARFKVMSSLMPRFEYRMQRFDYKDYQTSVINPLAYVGPAIDPGGATGLQRMLFLGADIPGYRAHIFSFTLEYHF